jgi:hypothetical protein
MCASLVPLATARTGLGPSLPEQTSRNWKKLMLSISKSVHRFLLPCFLLTGGLLYALPANVDKIVGQGEVPVGGGTATFNLNVSDPSNPKGHLRYRDEGADIDLRSTEITAYIVESGIQRRIEGTGVLDDGTMVTWTVNAFDDELGLGDQFNIAISGGYADAGFLNKGDIKIQPANP